MNLVSYAAKLLTNKYVLYLVVFLAASNVLGYIMIGQFKTVLFFTLTALLTSYFSRNMIVILLTALITTNVLISGQIIKEGLENRKKNTFPIQKTSENILDTTYEEEKLADIDKELKRGIDVLRETKGDVTKAKKVLEMERINKNT